MGFWSTKGGHFEKSAVLSLYSTELAMLPKLILKSIKKYVTKCWFLRVALWVQVDPPYMPTI